MVIHLIIIVIVIITTGAILVSKLLTRNCTLQVLDVSDNTIGDDGISVIVDQLQKVTNSRISKLWIIRCGISLTGARSIASLLSLNQSIRKLVLTDNVITTEGARLILQSAVNNKACQADIHIDGEYWSDIEERTMMKNLRDRRRMTTN